MILDSQLLLLVPLNLVFKGAVLTVMQRSTFGISLPNDILLKIDSERGDIPRSRYLLRLLERVYHTGNDEEKGAVIAR